MRRITLMLLTLSLLALPAMADDPVSGMRVLDEYDRAWCSSAARSIATDIINEDSGTAHHAERVQLAERVIRGETGALIQIRELVLATRRAAGDSPVYFAPRDPSGGFNFVQMKNQVSAIWNIVALIRYEAPAE
jgi:hypothetical protein